VTAAVRSANGCRRSRPPRARGRQALPTIDRPTGEIADRARTTIREAAAIARRAGRQLARSNKGAALAEQREREIAAPEQVPAQTDLRLAGQRTIPDRRIPLIDPNARSIRRGNPRHPNEFGFKAPVADTAEGFVTADLPERGNPNDDGLLEEAIANAKQTEMHLRSVYPDRGFGTTTSDAAIVRQRIRDPVIPRPRRTSPREQTQSRKRRYRVRNGLQGRISQLKRNGLRRTRLPSPAAAQARVGAITPAHNLQQIAPLT
jgi:IS5 family transposase